METDLVLISFHESFTFQMTNVLWSSLAAKYFPDEEKAELRI